MESSPNLSRCEHLTSRLAKVEGILRDLILQIPLHTKNKKLTDMAKAADRFLKVG